VLYSDDVMPPRQHRARMVPVLLVLATSGCARVYSARVGIGVERGRADETVAVAYLGGGFAGRLAPRRYLVGHARAGASLTESPDLTLGAGLAWTAAPPALAVELGPDYARRDDAGAGPDHLLGLRGALLLTLARSEADETNGLLDELFARPDPVRGSTGYGSGGGSEPAPHQVERRHGLGLEARAHLVVVGPTGAGTARGYLGLLYGFDVRRLD
jgi:hypothetical protein